MSQTLIKWRLREVMARYNIKAIDLAKQMKLSANAVSNLRQSKTMPRMDGGSLNNLCNALNALASELDEEITPMTLIGYIRDGEPGDRSNVVNSSSLEASQSTEKGNRTVSSRKISSSSLSLVTGFPESA
jgi:DNA-binding Xre family transcriptional regulator